MQMFGIRRPSLSAVLIGLSVLALPLTSTALVKWTLTSGNCISTTGPTNACGNTFADSRTFGTSFGAGPNVTATGWANTEPSTTNDTLAPGDIAQYGGGLGVRNADYNTSPGDAGEGTAPEHAMDNNGRFDLILFDFAGVDINLQEVVLGWYQTDADISVLAYTGSDDPLDGNGVQDLNGRNYTAATEDLTTNGWDLIGNYDVDSSAPSTYVQPISTTVSSSYWIVGAYNPVFPGCETGKCNGPETSWPDYVKVKMLSGEIDTTTPPATDVPEPGTLALLGLGLLGLVAARRRRSLA